MSAQNTALYNLDRPDEQADLDLKEQSGDGSRITEIASYFNKMVGIINNQQGNNTDYLDPEMVQIAYTTLLHVLSGSERTKIRSQTIAATPIFYVMVESEGYKKHINHWKVAYSFGIEEDATLKNNRYSKKIRTKIIELLGKNEEIRDAKLLHYKKKMMESVSKGIKKGNLTNEDLPEIMQDFSEFCALDNEDQYFLAFSLKDERPDTNKQKDCGPND